MTNHLKYKSILKLKVLLRSCFFFSVVMVIIVTSTQDENVNCRERNRLILSEKGDMYTLVDASYGEKLILQCHYCKEAENNDPKLWYTTGVFGSKPKEIQFGMKNEDSKNRLEMTSDHSLVILNITENDSGVYFCIGLEDQDNNEKINYLIDLVEKENSTDLETGNMTNWLKYHEDNMFPINYLFENSLSPEFVYIRERLKLSLELKTDWDPWSSCEVCGRTKGGGIRKRRGRCRIKIERTKGNEDYKMLTPDETTLVNAFELCCRSLLIQRIAPTVFNSTRIVSDFIETQHCEGVCNPDAQGVNAGWKVGKTKFFKYRKTVVLAEGDHLILVCPESTFENKVIWKRNGKELKRGEGVKPDEKNEEPRILVDTFSTLYLIEVKISEEGNYTCIVDDINMQQVVIFITSKSKILTKLFLRHMVYLGFVLSLTLTCYIGGIIIACNKRYIFKTYKMLKEESRRNGEVSSEEGDESS